MRPLSIVYVVLALLTLATTWDAHKWINTDFDTFVKDSGYTEDSGFVPPSGGDLEMTKGFAVGLASLCGGIFAVTVLGGEGYRYGHAGIKKVPVPPIPFSCVYVLLALLMVIEAGHAFRESTRLFLFENATVDAPTCLLWAMVSATVFVVFGTAGEIYLYWSHRRISNASTTQEMQEEAVMA